METTQLDFLGELRRTHMCGQLRAADAGSRVLLMGWVHRRRDLGGVIFIHLRDRDGVTQLVFRESVDGPLHAKAESLGAEYVIAAEGQVERRTPEAVNAAIPTGEVELVVDKLWILNESRTPPFPMEETVDVKEDARLKYRYVDLRRPHMQRNIILRSRISFAVRQCLYEQGFLEIETPFMTRSTPEGARDYLVPSRVQPGHFYALPQSPQIFKQLLMVSGYEKYFQIVRCFRDEDLRADRQPEFTQIDLEMSFPQQERIYETVEPLIERVCAVAGFKISGPFPRLTYAEAMRSYGSDKPDQRLPPFYSLDAAFAELPAFAGLKFPPVAIHIPKVGALTRKERDDFKAFGAERGLRVYDDLKKIDPEAAAQARSLSGASEEDLLIVAGWAGEPKGQRPEETFYQACGQLRLFIGQKYADRHKLLNPTDFRFLWVVDFPMFEWDEEENRWNAAHHPFTSVHDEDLEKLTSDPARCRAKSYDIVLNGTELGSGSIRIHRRDVQSKVFSALVQRRGSQGPLWISAGSAGIRGARPRRDRFGPGSSGDDFLAGETSIREVIPFPKTARGTDLMSDAPSTVPERLLRELGLKLLGGKN